MALPEFRLVGTLSGNAPETKHIPVAASETFLKGQCVQINSADALTESTGGTDPVYGVAAQDAPTTTGALCMVWPLNADSVFEALVDTGTPNDAEIGLRCDLDVAAGVHSVNFDAVAEQCFLIKDIVDISGDGTIDGVRVTGATGILADDAGAVTYGSQALGNSHRVA